MVNQKDIDAIINALDDATRNGSDHVNVIVKDQMLQDPPIIKKGMDVTSGDCACEIPNLQACDEDKEGR